jgi:predicted RNA-binding protein associated with RNAse of E/G family
MVRVRKHDWETGRETFAYDAVVVHHEDATLCVRAAFQLDRHVIDGVEIVRGDVFTEWYFRDRAFNVFHIAGADGRVKGWYCNVARPAEFDDEGVRFLDLLLDLFVHPDGRATILDEDEFAAARGRMSAEDVELALSGLEALLELRQGGMPVPRMDHAAVSA